MISSIDGELGVSGRNLPDLDLFWVGDTLDVSLGERLRLRASGGSAVSGREAAGNFSKAPADWQRVFLEEVGDCASHSSALDDWFAMFLNEAVALQLKWIRGNAKAVTEVAHSGIEKSPGHNGERWEYLEHIL